MITQGMPKSRLMNHALDIPRPIVEAQKIDIDSGEHKLTITNTMNPHDRKEILKGLQSGGK